MYDEYYYTSTIRKAWIKLRRIFISALGRKEGMIQLQILPTNTIKKMYGNKERMKVRE